jgi:hypothetical protein
LGIFDDLFSSKGEYGVESITLDGVKVKSKAEKFIADYFVRNSIQYQYEKPAAAHFWIFTNQISKPDFYLPQYDVYVEYWGLLDADKKRVSRDYERTMKWKMAMYHKHKIKFISLYPSNLENLDWIFRTKFKQVIGFDIEPRQTKYPSNLQHDTVPGVPQKKESEINFCSKCGSKVGIDYAFCRNCGNRLR